MKLRTEAEIRRIEEATVAQGKATWEGLMRRAGRAVAEVAAGILSGGLEGADEPLPHPPRDLLPPLAGKRVFALVGPGNNGGDALVALRELVRAGAWGEAFLFKRNRPDDWPRAEAEGIGVQLHPLGEGGLGSLKDGLARADLVLDGLFGVGLKRPLEGVLAAAVEAVNEAPVPVVAVDLPSGVAADTGQVLGTAVRAAVTVTFGSLKPGLVQAPGGLLAGQVRVVDIGLIEDPELPVREVLTAPEAARLLPARPADAHKYRFGRVLIVGGSRPFPGAPRLAALGALRTGAGLVTLAVPEPVYPLGAAALLETPWLPLSEDPREALARLLPAVEASQALVVGPGWGQSAWSRTLLEGLLTTAKLPPTVLDADALNLLAVWPEGLRALAGRPVVLTPHAGELARLEAGAGIGADDLPPWRRAVERARAWGVTVLLKGPFTTVAAPDGRSWTIPYAEPALAAGGTGDVLAGAIGALLAQGLPAPEGAALGAYLHARAGRLLARRVGPVGGLASEVAHLLPEVWRTLTG